MFQKSLRNLMITAVVSTPMVTLNAQNALVGRQDFRLHNRTPFTIERVYVSPSGYEDPGKDILGRNVLPSGRFTMITFSGYPSYICLFDITVVFPDGSYLQDSGFNLCRLTDVSVP